MNASRHRLGEIARRWYSSIFVYNNIDDERTHLLDRTFHTTCCEKLWILVLGLIFIGGVTASTYLLIMEGRDPAPHKFTIVTRSDWNSYPRCMNNSRIPLLAQKVLLLSTNTSHCWSESDCLKAVKKLQQEQGEELNGTDILYNFIVAGDERIYEGRGWYCYSSYEDNGIKLLTIAFLGGYNDNPLTGEVIQRLEAFLEYAIVQNKLSSCYQILVHESKPTFINELAFELELRRQKNIC